MPVKGYSTDAAETGATAAIWRPTAAPQEGAHLLASIFGGSGGGAAPGFR